MLIPRRLATSLLWFGVMLGVSLGALVWVAARGPETIGFGTGRGVPRGTVLGVQATVLVAVFAIAPVAATWADRLPGSRVAVPNKEYWANGLNRDAFRLRFVADVVRVCSLLGLAATATLIGAVQATNTGGTLPVWAITVVIVALMGVVLLLRRMWRSGYAIPPEQGNHE